MGVEKPLPQLGLQSVEFPCFLFQETHTIWEPDRLQDIWAKQKTTELDRGESRVISHTERNKNSTPKCCCKKKTPQD